MGGLIISSSSPSFVFSCTLLYRLVINFPMVHPFLTSNVRVSAWTLFCFSYFHWSHSVSLYEKIVFSSGTTTHAPYMSRQSSLSLFRSISSDLSLFRDLRLKGLQSKLWAASSCSLYYLLLISSSLEYFLAPIHLFLLFYC